jgi:hypothetical protein
MPNRRRARSAEVSFFEKGRTVMRKPIARIALVLVSCALVVACGQDKKLAEAALMKADEAVRAASPDIAQYAADSWKGVTDSLKAAQDAFARKDYKAALAAANEIPAKIQEAASVAMAKTDELTKAWTEMSESVPRMVEAIKSRVDTLSASKRLPAGMDKGKLEEAKTGLAAASQMWTEASDAAKAGNLTDALTKGNAVKDKAAQLMQGLGMTAMGGAATK